MKNYSLLTVLLCACSILAGCASLSPSSDAKADAEPDVLQTLRLKKTDFSQISGFSTADIDGFARAIEKSCAPILNKEQGEAYGPTALGGTVRDWALPCQATAGNADRAWLMEYFTPYVVYDDGDVQGLFTGYYEPLLHGSTERSDVFNTPLYMMPEDLVQVDLGRFSDDLKGKKISGRVEGNDFVPYPDRAAIDTGALDGRDLELVWVDDPVDAFFLHIQGSGLVEMTDGSRMRVGYAGQNGRSYYAIGRELIKRGDLDKENVSLQSIRAWLDQNPDQAAEFMQLNPSYIFFRKLEGDGPLGAQGVALTPMASLAVDRRVYPYGMPLLLQADAPMAGAAPLNRVMVAQDTGGAIRGAVRGDVFWGAGEQAALMAGHMKSQGRFWVFLPKTVEVPQEYQTRPGLWDSFISMFTGIMP